MWGFESMFKKKEKSRNPDFPESDISVTPTEQEVATEADAAIAKAKQTGDTHIQNLHNPNQHGSEVSTGPRKEVLKPMGISEDGLDDLRINPATLEATLENPTELGGPVARSAQTRQAAARAESLYVDPKEVEAALVSGELPDAVTIKKTPWQPDMFFEPRTKPLSPTPMGTVEDLRTKDSVEGVESDWDAARRAAKADNPEGLRSLRTPGGANGVEDDWKAAKRAAEGSKHAEGLGAFRTAPRNSFEQAKSSIAPERKRELRQNAERLILDLRKLIDATRDEAELKSMHARLAMAEKFYDENFKG